MGWKKVLAITGIVLAVLLVAASVAVYALSRPATLVPYEDEIPAATREQQTRITVALGVAGVDGAVVSVRDGTARAMYALPANSTSTPEDWQRTVLGAMAPLADGATTLMTLQLVDGKPSLEWTVPTEKVLAYQAGTLSASDLEAAVTKKDL